MNTIKTSSLGEIKSVFNDTNKNTHYYKILQKVLNGRGLRLEFAKPIIQESKGLIIWQTTLGKPYYRFDQLEAEKKAYVSNLIQKSLVTIAQILDQNTNQSIFDDIIEIAGEQAVFYTIDSENNISVVLTEWGFTKDEHIKSEGALKKLFSTSVLKSFIIKFVSNLGEVLSDIPCTIVEENCQNDYVSDADGVVKLNSLEKGSSVKVLSANDSFEEVNFVVGTLNEYTITVNRNFDLTFQFVNSNDEALVNNNFTFSSNYFPNKIFTTDSNGEYVVIHPEKEDVFKIESKEGEELLLEKIPNDNERYRIVFDPPIEPIVEEEKEVLQEIEDDKIVFEFLNWRRKPIKNQAIAIYGLNGKTNFTTNEEGIVEVSELKSNIDYSIFMNYKGTDWKKDFIHKGKNRYTFIVKMKKVLWWWIPFLIFFLLLLLITTTIDHQYTVKDWHTKQPIETAHVLSTEAGYYTTQGFPPMFTDSLGELSVDYGKFSIYSQIFKGLNAKISVRKYGYQSLDTTIPLGYFKTQESIVYLNKMRTTTPAIPKPSPCGGGENFDESGSKIKLFDLGKSNRTFLFEYYNDTALDYIYIYCQGGSIRSPLFSVTTTTDTDYFSHSTEIFAPCRYIVVEVIGTTNWGIKVNCPEE
ncbi:hypothetical protein [Tenacibaculum xiamenense]|uniref:hypothetical protein n=1 Tax=Tenacibaculum xiamenense TaxID=1261553 RepID=UPI0038934F84